MEAPSPQLIPVRAETLDLLRLMDDNEPLLMLPGDDDGYGSRWIFRGQQIEPAIARYLMDEGFIADDGATELGARRLALTTAGARFRQNGLRWWAGLSRFQRIRVRIFG
jgi:hypothetical protein